jgi:hypothetical protein
MSRRTADRGAPLLPLLAAALAGGCGGGGEGPPPGPAVGVYSEFLAYGDVEDHLDALARRGAALQVAVPAADVGDADLASLLRAADARRVEVRLWFVLDVAQGYWPNEANVDVFAPALADLLDWLDSAGLTAAAIVYDMEPAYAYTQELEAAFADNPDDAVALMRTHMDAAAFEAARTRFGDSVRAVQARGLRAECVTYPQVVDDLLDGDDDFQDGMDIPVHGVPFDEVSFMVYQTGFSETLGGGWVGPGLIASYAADARARFGERAVVALGLVGTAGIFEPEGAVYTDPGTLAADVAAALAAGVTRVEVYSLDGMVELGGPARWLEATHPEPAAAEPDDVVALIRHVAASIDEQLDAP